MSRKLKFIFHVEHDISPITDAAILLEGILRFKMGIIMYRLF